MRKLLLFVLALLPVAAGAQEFIRYYPPAPLVFDGANTTAQRNGTNAQTPGCSARQMGGY